MDVKNKTKVCEILKSDLQNSQQSYSDLLSLRQEKNDGKTSPPLVLINKIEKLIERKQKHYTQFCE